jgi:glutamine amidotransferase
MQLLAARSEEGVEPGLGWIDGEVLRFKFDEGSALKIPHMGWNTVHLRPGLDADFGIAADSRFYFVHSYHFVCHDPSAVAGTTRYGYPFVSIVRQGRVLGVQFHPEKSLRHGMTLMRWFAESDACARV